jgi:hypothetical protein
VSSRARVAVLRLRARRLCELIQQRERLLALGAENGKRDGEAVGRKTEATQSDANVGTGNGIVVQNQSPVVQKDPVFRHMESIGKAETWRVGQGSDQADPIRADAFPEYDI